MRTPRLPPPRRDERRQLAQAVRLRAERYQRTIRGLAQLRGKLPRAVVRPPLVKLAPEEIERIRAALLAAGLLGQNTSQRRVA